MVIIHITYSYITHSKFHFNHTASQNIGLVSNSESKFHIYTILKLFFRKQQEFLLIASQYYGVGVKRYFDLMIPTDCYALCAPASLRAATVGAKRTSTGRSAP